MQPYTWDKLGKKKKLQCTCITFVKAKKKLFMFFSLGKTAPTPQRSESTTSKHCSHCICPVRWASLCASAQLESFYSERHWDQNTLRLSPSLSLSLPFFFFCPLGNNSDMWETGKKGAGTLPRHVPHLEHSRKMLWQSDTLKSKHHLY